MCGLFSCCDRLRRIQCTMQRRIHFRIVQVLRLFSRTCKPRLTHFHHSFPHIMCTHQKCRCQINTHASLLRFVTHCAILSILQLATIHALISAALTHQSNCKQEVSCLQPPTAGISAFLCSLQEQAKHVRFTALKLLMSMAVCSHEYGKPLDFHVRFGQC